GPGEGDLGNTLGDDLRDVRLELLGRVDLAGLELRLDDLRAEVELLPELPALARLEERREAITARRTAGHTVRLAVEPLEPLLRRLEIRRVRADEHDGADVPRRPVMERDDPEIGRLALGRGHHGRRVPEVADLELVGEEPVEDGEAD